MKKSDQKEGKAGVYGPMLSVGLNMAVAVAVFSFVGYKIDQNRGGGYGFTLVGIFLGLGVGWYEVWKLIKQINEDG